MSDDFSSEDLAYVKAIAEEGRNVPLVGGVSFALWGCLIGTAALVFYCMNKGWLPFVHPIAYWGVVILGGWVTDTYLLNKRKYAPGASSIGNKIVNAAWFGCGTFISIYFLGLAMTFFLNFKEHPEVGYLFATLFPIAFGIYGIAFYVTKVATGQEFYKYITIGSWILAVILLLFVHSDLVFVVAGLGTYAVIAAPGFWMIKQQPSDVV